MLCRFMCHHELHTSMQQSWFTLKAPAAVRWVSTNVCTINTLALREEDFY